MARPVKHDSALLVRLPTELHDQLRAIAAAEDRSMAEVVRRAAEEAVANHQSSPAAYAAVESRPVDKNRGAAGPTGRQEPRRRPDRSTRSGSGRHAF